MLKWHGRQVMATLGVESRKRVTTSVLLVEAKVKTSMKKGGRTASGYLEEGQKPGKINAFRSKPGEVPREQEGTLKRSITHEVHPTLPIGRVGTNLPYGKMLELGTPNMKARPFLRPALHQLEPVIIGIFSKKVQ